MTRLHIILYTPFIWLLQFEAAIAQSDFAIITDASGCSFSTGKLDSSCIPSFLAHIIKLIFSLVGAVALIMILVSGYQIALAKAMGRDRSEGLTRLRVAVIGFILCALSWFILDFIISAIAGI